MDDIKEALKKAGIVKSNGGKMNNKIDFFEIKNGNKILKENMVTNDAEKWAQSFVDDKPKLTMNQLRKFYGEILTIENKIRTGISFEILKPQIKMIKSKVAYAYANGSNSKIPKSFKHYLDQMIDSTDNADDFKAFKMIFESVVGYSVGKGVR